MTYREIQVEIHESTKDQNNENKTSKAIQWLNIIF